jgi:hypothetical protein
VRLLPIRYCADVASSTRFYRALGLDVDAQARPGSWVELPAAAGLLALHQATDGVGDCELAFEADERLQAVVARLDEAGLVPAYAASAVVLGCAALAALRP